MESSSEPRYLGVRKHANGRYHIYPFRNQYGGSFPDVQSAAAECAKRRGVTVSELLLTAPAEPPAPPAPGTLARAVADLVDQKCSRYQAVYYHKGSRWRYVAADGSQVYGVSEAEGGQAVVKQFRLQQRSKSTMPLPALTDSTLKRYFMAFTAIYGDEEPGDLAAVRQQYGQHQSMFLAEPSTEVLWVQGKFLPWREGLFRTWTALQAQDQTLLAQIRRHFGTVKIPKTMDPALATRVLQVATLLQGAILAMGSTGIEVHQLWNKHCGHNNSFHSGFVPMLSSRFRFLTRSEGSRSPGASKNLQLVGTAGNYHCPVELTPHTLTQLGVFIKACDKLHSLMQGPVATTCKEWASLMPKLMQALKAFKAVSLNPDGGYLVPWTLRKMLIGRMTVAGVPRLTGAELVSVEEFASMAPDQKQWLLHFGKGCRNASQLMDRLDYSGPPELFSMRLCIYLADDLTRIFSVKWLEQVLDGLHLYVATHLQEFGQVPHPFALCSEGLRSDFLGCSSSKTAGLAPVVAQSRGPEVLDNLQLEEAAGPCTPPARGGKRRRLCDKTGAGDSPVGAATQYYPGPSSSSPTPKAMSCAPRVPLAWSHQEVGSPGKEI